MMTLDEIGSLQIGDKIQLPNGVEATVLTVNQSNKLIGLSMLSGTTTASLFPGEVPAERQDVETTIICAWADLTFATKLPPEAASTMSEMKKGKTAPTELPPPTFS